MHLFTKLYNPISCLYKYIFRYEHAKLKLIDPSLFAFAREEVVRNVDDGFTECSDEPVASTPNRSASQTS